MISISKTGISRFFYEIFNLTKLSEKNKSLALFNIFWVACIIVHFYDPSTKWDSWVRLLYLLAIPVFYGLGTYFIFKKPSI